MVGPRMMPQLGSFGSTSRKRTSQPPPEQSQPALPPPVGKMLAQVVQNRTLPSGSISADVITAQLLGQPQLPQPAQPPSHCEQSQLRSGSRK
jgi:hypothetical protein